MTDNIIRSIEIATGCVFIVATMFLSTDKSSQVMHISLVLLPLVALPLIFTGLFNWHPAKTLGKWLSRAREPVMSLTPRLKLRSLSH
ncbi:MAG: hypothetical protein PVJ39_15435 [Gammaproteobacteria bacterium]